MLIVFQFMDSNSSCNYDMDGNFRALPQLLPSSLITKIMQEVLTEDVKIDDAFKEGIQNCVASFILHLTAEACTKCEREGRKSITGDDILWSVDRLGFKDYEPPLRTFLRKHRAIESEERMRKRRADEAAFAPTPPSPQRPIQAIMVDTPGEGAGPARPPKRR